MSWPVGLHIIPVDWLFQNNTTNPSSVFIFKRTHCRIIMYKVSKPEAIMQIQLEQRLSHVKTGSSNLKIIIGAVHKGRPQRRGGGLVKCGHMRTGGGGGVKDLADVRKLALFF